jgi:hypothetical protein
MSEHEHDPAPEGGRSDAERDLAEHERPDVGLIGDEDLPEDLRPTDDNPLAKDPDDEEESSPRPPQVEGVPDMGSPGPPA